jgi:hypothetical protein
VNDINLYWSIGLFGMLLYLCSAVFFSFRARAEFDNLLKLLYANHRNEWERLGEPIGFHWRPISVKRFTWFPFGNENAIARTKTVYRWMFNVPTWITGNQDARGAYARYRRAFLIVTGLQIIQVLCIIGLIVFALYLMNSPTLILAPTPPGWK